MDIPEVDTRRGIDWSMVLQANAEKKDPQSLQQTFLNVLAASEVLKNKVSIPEELEENVAKLVVFMTVIISDCVDAGKLPSVPLVYINPEIDPDAAASVSLGRNNQWMLEINPDSFISAAKSLAQGSYKSGISPFLTFLYTVAHEMGHIRGVSVLGMNPRYDDFVIGSIVKELAGDDVTDMTSYTSDQKEVHADAFATRYLRAKVNDPDAAPLWNELDFSELEAKKWKIVGDHVFLRSASKFEELMEKYHRSQEGVAKEEIKRKALILVESIKTHPLRLKRAVEVIRSKSQKTEL